MKLVKIWLTSKQVCPHCESQASNCQSAEKLAQKAEVSPWSWEKSRCSGKVFIYSILLFVHTYSDIKNYSQSLTESKNVLIQQFVLPVPVENANCSHAATRLSEHWFLLFLAEF